MPVLNTTIDLNDTHIITEGSWTRSVSSGGKALLQTTDSNAAIVFTFDGPSISVAGSLSSNVTDSTANLAYTLDGFNDSMYTLDSTNGLLYASSDLPSGHHTLRMTLNNNATELSIQSVTITLQEQPSKFNVSALVGGVIGGVVFLILAILLLLLYRRRIHQKSNSARQSLQRNSRVSIQATSGNDGPHELSLTRSPTTSTETFTSIPSRKQFHHPDFSLIRTMNNVPTVNLDDIV